MKPAKFVTTTVETYHNGRRRPRSSAYAVGFDPILAISKISRQRDGNYQDIVYSRVLVPVGEWHDQPNALALDIADHWITLETLGPVSAKRVRPINDVRDALARA